MALCPHGICVWQGHHLGEWNRHTQVKHVQGSRRAIKFWVQALWAITRRHRGYISKPPSQAETRHTNIFINTSKFLPYHKDQISHHSKKYRSPWGTSVLSKHGLFWAVRSVPHSTKEPTYLLPWDNLTRKHFPSRTFNHWIHTKGKCFFWIPQTSFPRWHHSEGEGC